MASRNEHPSPRWFSVPRRPGRRPSRGQGHSKAIGDRAGKWRVLFPAANRRAAVSAEPQKLPAAVQTEFGLTRTIRANNQKRLALRVCHRRIDGTSLRRERPAYTYLSIAMKLISVEVEGFFGFQKPYKVDFDNLTVLVGPNNGGKTTVLRAVRLVLDTIRMYFGENQPTPSLQNIGAGEWSVNANNLLGRFGFATFAQFSFGLTGLNEAKATLVFRDINDKEVNVSVRCRFGNQVISATVNYDGHNLAGSDTEQNRAIIHQLYNTRVQFVPPMGTVSPFENALPFGQLTNQIAGGHYAQTWRNQLHWLSEGKGHEQFRKLSDLIREQLGLELLPPRRSQYHDPPTVVVEYVEDGVAHDISAAGGGLRTLVLLVSAIELSGASIVLLDEPDAHLHSQVQRRLGRLLTALAADGRRQIVVATHAPDLIDEVPLESLRWVDKTTRPDRAEPCDSVGKMLVDLGATSQAQAIQTLGTDLLLYFENTPDKDSLKLLMTKCGKTHLVERFRPAKSRGFGDIKHLPSVLRMLRELMPAPVIVAAIRDADYLSVDAATCPVENDDVLVVSLPCKELENLLILDGRAIAKVAKEVSEERARRIGATAVFPTAEQVEAKIDEISGSEEMKEVVRGNWGVTWSESNSLVKPADFNRVFSEFDSRWRNISWRRRCCPGKRILARVKEWLQAPPYNVGALTLQRLFAALEPSPELQAMFDALDAFVEKQTVKS
jgi:hypothetical protein